MGKLLIFLVRIYQLALSPFLGGQCRFYPSCSEYFIEAVRRNGVARGTLLGATRLCKCHPFHPGGFDPVIEGKREKTALNFSGPEYIVFGS